MDTAPLEAEQATFRTTLWSWLGGAAVLLLVFQLALVRWGLRPLHRIAANVREIEEGRRQQVGGPVPRELYPLTDNLNSLIRQGQARQERLRHGLADLAHSLKTPLAVLRGAAHRPETDRVADLIDEQVERIDDIIRYHRQRAAVAGDNVLYPPLALGPVLQRIVDSLQKVHRERGIRCDVNIAADMRLRADQGDLFELFGNLLENAFKHAHTSIQVSGSRGTVHVEDDGPGIAQEQVPRLLRRGERADQRHPGQGIGLALALEIVKQYGGTLDITSSPLGGARVSVDLPAAGETRSG
jgi:two-component system sensor histidine kinase PhoQ